jgi:hypothetical protein
MVWSSRVPYCQIAVKKSGIMLQSMNSRSYVGSKKHGTNAAEKLNKDDRAAADDGVRCHRLWPHTGMQGPNTYVLRNKADLCSSLINLSLSLSLSLGALCSQFWNSAANEVTEPRHHLYTQNPTWRAFKFVRTKQNDVHMQIDHFLAVLLYSAALITFNCNCNYKSSNDRVSNPVVRNDMPSDRMTIGPSHVAHTIWGI